MSDTFRIDDGVAWIGERSFPWAKTTVEDIDIDGGSRKWRTRRILLPFENGWSLSVIWGSGAYAANYHDGAWLEASPTAELWGWSATTGRHITEDVIGHLPPADVLAWIERVAAWSSDHEPARESA